MKNELKAKALAGEKTLGTFFELGSSTVAECMGLAGLDYMIIDTEHGPFSPESAMDYIRAAKLYGTTPLARTSDISRASILRLLDVGAMGLIIPDVHTIEDVKKIVKYGKYYPLGSRGIANTSGSGFWYEEYCQQGLPHYFETSNNETLLIPQCETEACLNDLEAILSVDGIDGVFTGPFDLSASLGKPGQLDDPLVTEAIEHILQTCKKLGKFSIIYAAVPEKAKEYFDLGYDSVTLGMDAAILVDAYKDQIKAILS